jgi:hypothetical protein
MKKFIVSLVMIISLASMVYPGCYQIGMDPYCQTDYGENCFTCPIDCSCGNQCYTESGDCIDCLPPSYPPGCVMSYHSRVARDRQVDRAA